MRTYPCKKPIKSDRIRESISKIIGDYREENGYFITRFPPIEEIRIRIKGEKEIEVETKTGQGGNSEVAIRKFNDLVEEITGYSAKERKKLLIKG